MVDKVIYSVLAYLILMVGLIGMLDCDPGDAIVNSPDTLPKIEITAERLDDLFDQLSKNDPWDKTNDGSSISWVESYTLSALVDLYEATENVRYLEEIELRGKRLLSHRDDYRGVVDGSGHSRPAWSTASKYVVAQGNIISNNGRSAIKIRSTPSAYNNFTKVEITDFQSNDHFNLSVSNEHFKRYEYFENLSLYPDSKRFIKKIVNDPLAPYSTRRGHYNNKKSNLIRIEFVNDSIETLLVQSITLKPIPLSFMGYIGIIYDPLMRFSEIVLTRPDLLQFKPTVELFIKAAEESYEDASKRLWRTGPDENEGYYLMCEKGESMPADNVGQPFNYLAKHVVTQLALYRLTGKKDYKIRAQKMINLFINRLQYDSTNDLYIWYYWYEPMTTTGWNPDDNISYNVKYFPPAARIEDVSHGALDMDLVMSAYQMNIVFTQKDVRRFANTLVNNVILNNHAGVSRLVDGTGQYPRYINALHRWLELAEVDPQVYHEIKKTYLKVGQENFGFSANLLRWKSRLEPE